MNQTCFYWRYIILTPWYECFTLWDNFFFFFLLEIHIELLNTAGSKMACMGCVTHRPWMMYWSVQLCCSRFIDMFFNASEPPSGDPSCAPCLSQACARRSDFTRHQSQPTRLHYSRGVSGPISLLGTQSTTRILLKEGGGQMVTTKSVLEVSLKCWPPLKWMDTYSRVCPLIQSCRCHH